MSAKIIDKVPAGNVKASGLYQPMANGARKITLAEDETYILSHRFSLPRDAIVGKGSILDSITYSYVVVSGSLTSATPALKKLVTVADATITAEATVAVTSTAAATAVSTSLKKMTSTVDEPMYDNQAATNLVEFEYKVTIVAAADAVLNFYGFEVVYFLDIDGGDLVVAAKTSSATLTVAEFSKIVPITMGATAITITLPAPADNLPARVHLKVIGVDEDTDPLPDLLVKVTGDLDIYGNGEAAGDTLTVTAAKVGDFLTLDSSHTSTTGAWGLTAARGTIAIDNA